MPPFRGRTQLINLTEQMTPCGRLWNWTLPPRRLNSLGMRLAIACLIPCLNLLQVAPAQDDSQPNPVLVDPAPDQEPDADEVPEEEKEKRHTSKDGSTTNNTTNSKTENNTNK